ncbi:MAG: 4Fe-4S dicluster domain-containing protein [Desulfobacula sp.]|nr:4Fe-4S dicluster domain-containing protein [Desulfobacula sp.]
MESITYGHVAPDFVDQVEMMSHANLSRCFHCLACSAGCPFCEDMDYLPNVIIRMVQFGMKEAVLKSSTIWLCVGCNTCSMECPNSVDMAAVMDSLRQIAVGEGIQIAETGIYSFHNAVVDSISRYGRTHKLEIMMRYKICEKEFFTDIDLGLKMLSKRKLDLLPSRVKDKKAIKSLFEMAEGK